MKTLSCSSRGRWISSSVSKYSSSAFVSCFRSERYSGRGGRDTLGTEWAFPQHPDHSPPHIHHLHAVGMTFACSCLHLDNCEAALILVKFLSHCSYLLQAVRSQFSATEHLQCARPSIIRIQDTKVLSWCSRSCWADSTPPCLLHELSAARELSQLPWDHKQRGQQRGEAHHLIHPVFLSWFVYK